MGPSALRRCDVVPDRAESLAHAPEWRTIIEAAYGHEPLYLKAEDEAGQVGVLPAFVVRRPLFGTVVTSMPFLDGGGPCSSSPSLSHMLVEQLIAEARRRRARFVDVRCAVPCSLTYRPSDHKVDMTLRLPSQPDALWRGFDKSVRNQIRKAERSGLSVDCGRDASLAEFYDIFAARMRDLGSPVHAFRFLRATVDAFGSRARVMVVRKGREAVGGLIALAHHDMLTVPWAACSKEHFASCPNMLLYWAAIRAACAEGFSAFGFGRSTRQSGTYRFKRQWGATEAPIYWYRIPLASAAAAQAPHRSGSIVTKIWERLPLPVTRCAGPRIRRFLIE